MFLFHFNSLHFCASLKFVYIEYFLFVAQPLLKSVLFATMDKRIATAQKLKPVRKTRR